MKNSLQKDLKLLELNGRPSVRNYSAEMVDTTCTNNKKSHSCSAMQFSLRYLGNNVKGNLEYRLTVNKRLFLDEKMLRLIRANYIHTSSHYNDKADILGTGGFYAPHHPRDSYMTREREENDG